MASESYAGVARKAGRVAHHLLLPRREVAHLFSDPLRKSEVLDLTRDEIKMLRKLVKQIAES